MNNQEQKLTQDPHQLELFEVENDRSNYEYEQLSDPDLRYKYVRYTEGLIARAVDEEKDTLVFLDKSARPVAWLMKALWPTLGFKDFDDSGKPIPVPMPDIKFVNIDREQWAMTMGRSEDKHGEGITTANLHPSTINSLRGLFTKRTVDIHDELDDDEPTMFDDKNVLIVDEVSASGDTLKMSEKLFETAFPAANSFEGTHWMTPDKKEDKKSGGMRNADLPVWYRKDTAYGRLVGDRDIYLSSLSTSTRQRRGAVFLSHPFPEIDIEGRKLKKEMELLGKEVRNGDMPVVMDGKHRPDDLTFVQNFMKHINHLDLDEFVTLRRQATKERMAFSTIVNEYKRDRYSV